MGSKIVDAAMRWQAELVTGPFLCVEEAFFLARSRCPSAEGRDRRVVSHGLVKIEDRWPALAAVTKVEMGGGGERKALRA